MFYQGKSSLKLYFYQSWVKMMLSLNILLSLLTPLSHFIVLQPESLLLTVTPTIVIIYILI